MPPASTASVPKPTAWGFVLTGFASLLTAAYYDNVRGPLMPAMAADLGLSFGLSGSFLAVGHAVATVTTLLLIRALNLWSERAVLVVLCAGGVGVALFAPQVRGVASMLVLAGLIGSTISTLGTMCNVLIVEGAAPQHLGRFLAMLHTMFGVGSMLATTLVARRLAAGAHWSELYRDALPVYVLLPAFAWFALKRRKHHAERTIQPARLNGRQALVVATIAIYVAGEVTFSMWLTTYLVDVRGMVVVDAAPYQRAYFLVMTLGRLACAAFITPRWEKAVIAAALAVPVACFAAGYLGWSAAFLGVGLYGPFFPVFLARSSRLHPDRWRSVTIWTIVVMNVAIGAFNIGLGGIADALGVANAYLMPPLLLLAALALALWSFRLEPKKM